MLQQVETSVDDPIITDNTVMTKAEKRFSAQACCVLVLTCSGKALQVVQRGGGSNLLRVQLGGLRVTEELARAVADEIAHRLLQARCLLVIARRISILSSVSFHFGASKWSTLEAISPLRTESVSPESMKPDGILLTRMFRRSRICQRGKVMKTSSHLACSL